MAVEKKYVDELAAKRILTKIRENKTSAAAASSAAAKAQSTADAAKSAASKAQSAADTAKAAADAADAKAVTAQSTANTAKTNAATAQTTANAAKADAKKANDAISDINASIGVPDGIASLDENGRVPAVQLPSFVDDVLEFSQVQNISKPTFETSSAAGSVEVIYLSSTKTFVAKSNGKYYANWVGGDMFGVSGANGKTPDAGKIYVETSTNKTYRWGGSTSGLVEISTSLATGTTSGTAYPGNEGAKNRASINALESWKTNTVTPHITSSTQKITALESWKQTAQTAITRLENNAPETAITASEIDQWFDAL